MPQSPPESGRARIGQWWLAWLLGTTVFLPVLEHFLPNERIRTGLLVTDLAAGVIAIVAVALWFQAPASGRWPVPVQAFLGGIVALWALIAVLAWTRSEFIRLSTWLLPLLIALVWFRRSPRADILRAADVFALSLAGLSVGYLVLQVVGVVPDTWLTPIAGYEAERAELLAFEQQNYWLPLSWLPGVLERWSGPFGNPNWAGPVGALLVVFGAARAGWRRVVFVSAGGLILVLSGVRASFISTAAGLAVLLAVRWALSRQPDSVRTRGRGAVLAAGLGVAVLAAALVATNLTLTGRTVVWPSYLHLWWDHPLAGVGDAGIGQAQAAGLLPDWAATAHNVPLDEFTRHGTLAGFVVLALALLALWIAARGSRISHGAGPAVVTVILVGGLVSTIMSWDALGVSTVGLILAVLLSVPGDEDHAPSQTRSTRSTPGR